MDQSNNIDQSTGATCDHDVVFDRIECENLSKEHKLTRSESLEVHNTILVQMIRERWPRLDGQCPLGCGFHGIAYASVLHYVCGDW